MLIAVRRDAIGTRVNSQQLRQMNAQVVEPPFRQRFIEVRWQHSAGFAFSKFAFDARLDLRPPKLRCNESCDAVCCAPMACLSRHMTLSLLRNDRDAVANHLLSMPSSFRWGNYFINCRRR